MSARRRSALTPYPKRVSAPRRTLGAPGARRCGSQAFCWRSMSTGGVAGGGVVSVVGTSVSTTTVSASVSVSVSGLPDFALAAATPAATAAAPAAPATTVLAPLSPFEFICPLRGRARADEKGDDPGVARDADLLALVLVSPF